MGMGMLFAGALAGGARAVGEMADQAIKREDDSLARQQSIMDRRNELLFEMKAKADMAQEQERADAEGYVKASERGRAIGDDRRFSKFREDIRATGGGEGMSEDELRGVFNENYNDKVVAGSDRYYEPESADKRDALQAARSSGASGRVIAGLNEEYRGLLGAERQAKQDADREAREDRRYREQAERDDLRFERQQILQDRRGAGGAAPTVRSTKTNSDGEVVAVMSDGTTKPLGFRDKDFSKTVANMVTKMGQDRRYRGMSEDEMKAVAIQRLSTGSQQAPQSTETSSTESRAAGDVEALQKEIAAVERGRDNPEVKRERLRILGHELEKAQSSLALKSAVKDNQTTSPKRYIFVDGKIVPK